VTFILILIQLVTGKKIPSLSRNQAVVYGGITVLLLAGLSLSLGGFMGVQAYYLLFLCILVGLLFTAAAGVESAGYAFVLIVLGVMMGAFYSIPELENAFWAMIAVAFVCVTQWLWRWYKYVDNTCSPSGG
jgi:hypothetical protein